MSAIIPLNNIINHKFITAKYMLDKLLETENEIFANKAYDEIAELLEYLYAYEPFYDDIMKIVEIKNYFDEAFDKESSEPLNEAYKKLIILIEKEK